MFGSFTEKPYFCIEVRTSVVQKKTNKLLINNKKQIDYEENFYACLHGFHRHEC